MKKNSGRKSVIVLEDVKSAARAGNQYYFSNKALQFLLFLYIYAIRMDSNEHN